MSHYVIPFLRWEFFITLWFYIHSYRHVVQIALLLYNVINILNTCAVLNAYTFVFYVAEIRWSFTYIWFKYALGQKYHAPHVWPDQGSNSWPPDHDSTVHVTETPTLTTRPSVTWCNEPITGLYPREFHGWKLCLCLKFSISHSYNRLQYNRLHYTHKSSC